MTWAAVAIGGGAALGTGLASAFGGKKGTTATQVPLETPEQAAARQGLLAFAQTGKYGDFTAGTPYAGSLGDFGLSTLEKTGLSRIASGPGASPLFDTGSQALTDLLSTDKYNPLNQTGMIQGLNSAIDYNTGQAVTAAKRDAGYAGNLYSTDAVRNLGNVEAQGANTKAVTLAGLYQNYINSKLGAIPQAFSGQAQLDQRNQQQLTNELSYGGIPRSLNTSADQSQYAEFQRQQQEKGSQIDALKAISGQSTPFGVQSVSLPNANPWLDVINLLAQFGGKYAGSKLGGSNPSPGVV